MSITIVAMAGAANANSYNTEAEVEAVAATLFPVPEGWNVSNELKKRAMVTMAEELDRLTFPGTPTTTTQARAWPRSYVREPRTGADVAATTIPPAVKLAHARMTIATVIAGQNIFEPSDDAGVSGLTLGSEVGLTFEAGATSKTAGEAFLAKVVYPILGYLVRMTQPRLV